MIDFIGLPEPGSRRPFSRATKAAGLIFVSGSSAPHDPGRGIHRGDTAAEQVRNSLQFIAETLNAAGSGLDRVVQVTMLITDPADYDACNAECEAFPRRVAGTSDCEIWGSDRGQGRVLVHCLRERVRTARLRSLGLASDG
jgi:2-iminobutanoate/2-iminopropanoate deaminase